MSKTIYTFDGSSFYRKVDSAWRQWFASKVEYTRDAVLDSDEDYLDIGATSYEPLEITAIVSSKSEQTTLQDKIGTTAVLANSRSYSQDATLISAEPIAGENTAEYLVTLVFLRRPTGSA
jgi:hypothetical protein